MAQLTQFYPTDAGRALLAIVNTGACKLEISKGQVSDGTDDVATLRTLEALTGNLKDMPIISKEKADEHSTIISTTISNAGVTTPFLMREYGLYAKAYNADGSPIMEGDTQKEILFVVATDSDPDTLYQAGSTPITLQLDVTLAVDGDMDVTVKVDPAGLVTVRKLEQHDNDENAHPQLIGQLRNDLQSYLPKSGGIVTGDLAVQGILTAITQNIEDESTRVATTEFVKQLLTQNYIAKGSTRASYGESGFRIFSDGFCIQWGYYKGIMNPPRVYFPISFNVKCAAAVVQPVSNHTHSIWKYDKTYIEGDFRAGENYKEGSWIALGF